MVGFCHLMGICGAVAASRPHPHGLIGKDPHSSFSFQMLFADFKNTAGFPEK